MTTAIEAVKAVPALRLRTRGPKAWAIESAAEAGRAAARVALNDREVALHTAGEAFCTYLIWGGCTSAQGLQLHRVAKLEVDAFCDAYDAEIDAHTRENRR